MSHTGLRKTVQRDGAPAGWPSLVIPNPPVSFVLSGTPTEHFYEHMHRLAARTGFKYEHCHLLASILGRSIKWE